jgi:tRNA threonylcarbamoyladenosine biosynthesis protein TsaE
MFQGKGKRAQMPRETWVIQSPSSEETFRLGERIGANLHGGCVLLLLGPIGAGKSVIVRGIASALGIQRFRGSPTFNLVHEYSSEPPLYHADLYRLGNTEIEELGLDEYARPDSVLAVEWADRAAAYLGGLAWDCAIWIDLEIVGPDDRLIRVRNGVLSSSSPDRCGE